MAFDLLHRLATVGTLITGLAALGLSGEFGPATLLPSLLAFAAGPFLWRPFDRRWAVPASGVLAVAVGTVTVLWALSTTDYLLAAILYSLFLAALKTLFLRHAGDFLQSYVLSFLHVMAAAVVNPGLSFGVAMLPYVILLTVALMLTNLRRGIEALATSPGGAGGAEADALRLAAALQRRDLVRPAFMTATVGITVGVFLVSLVFFFLFPRLGLGFFAQQSRRGLAVSGFSEEVKLGDFGTIAEDPEVVMRVKPKSGPATGPLRMRGQSLDRYDGTTWRKTTARRRQLQTDVDGRLRLAARRDPLDVPGVQVQEVYLEPMLGTPRVLFAPPQPAAFERPSNALEALRPGQWRFFADEAGDVSLTGPPAVAIVYTAFSDPRPVDAEAMRASGTDDPEWVRDLYLPLPPQQEGVQALARSLAEGAANRYDLALRVEAALKDGWTYSLSSSHGDQDPLADFLLHNREGHCEYFASAMVVLLRLQGVPARIVNGFYGGVSNEYGDYVALRRADAHSWVEVHFPGLGWATFDPTPASALDLRSATSWWKGVSDAIDATKLAWYRWVVEYNLEKQISFLSALFNLRRGGEGFGDSMGRKDFREIRDRLREVPWRALGLGILGLAAGAGGLVLLARRRRKAGPGVLLAPGDPVLQAYVRLRRAMDRAGFRRAPSETQSELARRVAASFPEAAGAVQDVTKAYLDRAFGGQDAPPGLDRRVEDAIAALPSRPPGQARRGRFPS